MHGCPYPWNYHIIPSRPTLKRHSSGALEYGRNESEYQAYFFLVMTTGDARQCRLSMYSSLTYTYEDLESPDSVRLLHLEPAGDWHADLHGSLVRTRLSVFDDQVVNRFITLSYCWGDPAPTDTVYLDGVAIGITENLGAALRDICDAAQAQLIWADALSINQADIPERNWQVRLMGEIYRRSGSTIIYLGHLVEDLSWYIKLRMR
jgi:hypothetical protein